MRFFTSRSMFWRISARMRATSPSSTPRAFANSASTTGSFGSATWFTVDGEFRGLALEVLDVVLGEDDREGLRLAFGEPRQRRLEVGQHAALAQHDGEVLALAALEGRAVDLALEVDVDQVAVCAAPRVTRSYLARCLRSVSMRGVDVLLGHLASPGAPPCAPARSPMRDLGIDLEDRLELERRPRRSPPCDGLEARHAGHAVVLRAHRLGEAALHASPRAPPGAPGSRSGARPS